MSAERQKWSQPSDTRAWVVLRMEFVYPESKIAISNSTASGPVNPSIS